MRSHRLLVALFLAIFFLILTPSSAETPKPDSILSSVDQIFNQTSQWLNFSTKYDQAKIEFSFATVLAAVFCFIAAAISSAGGIGGGGLYIPIMTIVAGVDLKTASSFSAFMVTGGSIANVGSNLFVRNPKSGGNLLIDFDLALLLEPCMLLGVSIGVICNLVFPNWLVTILFAIFLAWSTIKTCNNGIHHWNLESEKDKHSAADQIGGNRKNNASTEPLLSYDEKPAEKFPWMKLGVLVMIWFSFFAVYLLRGNKYGEGIISIEPCGIVYWVLSSLQIPLALAFTCWICRSDTFRTRNAENPDSEKGMEDDEAAIAAGRSNKCLFPVMAFMAGLLGGLFGIGGGMLISPLLLQVGISPEVTAATCSFMVLFSSTMSAIQYLLLGMEQTEAAMIFALVCFAASLVGLVLVQRAINEYGRASIIVFSVGIVMALSTILMTSYGALDVWDDFVTGRYMGFKLPC